MRFSSMIVFVLAVLGSMALAVQVPNESLANAIVAARQRNTAMLQHYNWNQRIEILRNNTMEDLRIDLVSANAAGQLTRTVLNDQPGQLPGLFLRRAIEHGQQQQVEKTVQGMSGMVDQYTIAGAGKVGAFIVSGALKPITTPTGQSLLQISGNNVVMPGDTVVMTFNGTTLQPVSASITTTYEGDAVTISASFSPMGPGVTALQYATAQIPSKQITVMIHNYDFVKAF